MYESVRFIADSGLQEHNSVDEQDCVAQKSYDIYPIAAYLYITYITYMLHICILYLYVQLYTYLEGRPRLQRFYGGADGSDGSEESRSLFPAAHADRWPGHVGDRQECSTPNGTCFIIPSLVGLSSILASYSSHPGSILHKPLGCRCRECITTPTQERPNNSLNYWGFLG